MDSGRYWSVRSRVDLAHRHGLDQAQIEAVLAAPFDHVVDLVLVDALQRHGVDLDLKPGRFGGQRRRPAPGQACPSG